MTNDWDDGAEEPRRSRRWLWMVVMLVATFALGVAATLYVLRRSEPVRRLSGIVPAVTVAAAPVVMPRAVPRTPGLLATAATADLSRRVAGIERGLVSLAERTTQTSSNAARAEGLLVAFAARRALDRGTPLGYIEGLLRERFGGGQPQAVATILSASRQPVTLEELQMGLDAIAPQLATREPDESWWAGIRREFSGVIVLRRASAPSVAPVDRITRARRQLETGHVDLALAEVARLPGRVIAADWIGLARRYAGARRALDIIETAALLAPHEPLVPVAPVAPAVPATTASRVRIHAFLPDGVRCPLISRHAMGI